MVSAVRSSQEGDKACRWARARAMPFHYSLRGSHSQVNQFKAVKGGYVAGVTAEGKAVRANQPQGGCAARIGPGALPPRDVQTCNERLGRLCQGCRSVSAEDCLTRQRLAGKLVRGAARKVGVIEG